MSDDYDIGYKKPPRHSRFKPGQSGNPRGRPKKVVETRDTYSIIEKVLATKVTRRETGARSSLREVIFERACVKGATGTTADLKLALAIIAEADRQKPSTDSKHRTGVLVVPARLSEEEWDAMYAKPRPDSVEQIEKEPKKK